MNRNLRLTIGAVWIFSLLLDLLSGVIGITHKIAMFFPAVYLFFSFPLFNRLVTGYRLFHHICITALTMYYLLGVISNTSDVFDKSYVVSHMAYGWFSGLAITYLVFCFMLFILYAPYAIYKKVQNKSTT